MQQLGEKSKLLYEDQTYKLNGIAFKVQKELGRFAREKQYCDLYEKYLIEAAFPYKRELTIGDSGNRLDFFIFDCIPVEMKAKPFLLKEDYYQTQRYLQILNSELGIIYNFRDYYIKPKRILRETRKNPQASVNPDSIRKSGSGYLRTISVIIPAYNEEKYIGATLKSVVDNAPENLLEIIVVNNACTDSTAQIASAFPKVRVVNESNKGLTRARQAGLVAAQGELLAYVDADSLVSKDWFNDLNKQFTKDPQLIFLSGPYIYYDTPAWQQWCVKWLYYGTLARLIYFFTGYMASGGNFTVKKEALLQIGGFNTKIEFYGEDTDIVKRLSAVGKVKFDWGFIMATSARRFAGEGTFKTGAKYVANYTAIMLTKKPLSKKYTDVR